MIVTPESRIMASTRPEQIFSMNPDTLDAEYENFCYAFKPAPYSTIQNFVVTKKVTELYREAKRLLSEGGDNVCCQGNGSLLLERTDGTMYEFQYSYSRDTKIAKMYFSEKYIVWVLPTMYRSYYENYLRKTRTPQKVSLNLWESVQYMMPKVVDNFETVDGHLVIVVVKPSNMVYPLREILDFYGGYLRPEYVSAIAHRLLHFISYLEITGINHNGITLDNLFFSPGRFVDKGEEIKVEDVRFVGVYGGWFFSTFDNEKLKGLPKEVFEVAPEQEKHCGYSSYRVDVLAIKRVALELLGNSLDAVPDPMCQWLNDKDCKKNVYEEYQAWEAMNKESFGKNRFIEMDLPI